MPVLRRVDMGTISDGRRDKASSGTFVARRGAVLTNNLNPEEASGLMTMCTCEDVVRRKGFFFLVVYKRHLYVFRAFKYHFRIYFLLVQRTMPANL
jgi:hypothetical protein